MVYWIDNERPSTTDGVNVRIDKDGGWFYIFEQISMASMATQLCCYMVCAVSSRQRFLEHYIATGSDPV